MAFYRIVIWTNEAKKQGIRWIDNSSISAVQGIMEHKAREVYRSDLKEVEVQMLSKTSKAVKRYLKDQERKLYLKNHPPTKTTASGGYRPRDRTDNLPNWGENVRLQRLEAEAKAAKQDKGKTTGK